MMFTASLFTSMLNVFDRMYLWKYVKKTSNFFFCHPRLKNRPHFSSKTFATLTLIGSFLSKSLLNGSKLFKSKNKHEKMDSACKHLWENNSPITLALETLRCVMWLRFCSRPKRNSSKAASVNFTMSSLLFTSFWFCENLLMSLTTRSASSNFCCECLIALRMRYLSKCTSSNWSQCFKTFASCLFAKDGFADICSTNIYFTYSNKTGLGGFVVRKTSLGRAA